VEFCLLFLFLTFFIFAHEIVAVGVFVLLSFLHRFCSVLSCDLFYFLFLHFTFLFHFSFDGQDETLN